MVKWMPALWRVKVIHHRRYPRENRFSYRVFYLVLDMHFLSDFSNRFFSHKKFALLRYRDKDHGRRDGSSALEWAKEVFASRKIMVNSVRLVTMPSVLGYVFNPVSFWLGYRDHDLCAIICEVNNTFGQTHSYVCYDFEKKPISFEDSYVGEKKFHVSPFYPRRGEYRFKFDIDDERQFYKIIIHYYDQDSLQLVTSMQGSLRKMTRLSILREFFLCPFVGMKVMMLIHYQALKLFIKKTRFHTLPVQANEQLTDAFNVNKENSCSKIL